MIDVDTRKNIIVLGADGDYPHFFVPVTRLKDLQTILEAEEIIHHVDRRSISLNDGPFVIAVTLDHPPDAGRVQVILNSLP